MVAALLTFTLLGNLLAFCMTSASAQAAGSIDLKLEASSAILLEASTGQVLYELNADKPLPPASMAKMMTEYLVMESIESGKLKWDDIVTTSKYASQIIGSGQLLAEGDKLTVKDMFYAMSIYSANDATIALAERIAGTEENFAKMANEKAKQLGMKTAHFINSTGLSRADLGDYAPKSIPGETVMSARDAATLAYHIIKEHKQVLDFTKIPSKKLRETDAQPMINWNWMLEGNKDNVYLKKYAYPGLDGLKTGHTNEAGYCFTGTAERNGMRLISVVMGTSSEPKRFEETRKLLDYGFTNFELKTIIPAKSEISSVKTVAIKKGVKTEVPVVTQTNIDFVVQKGEAADKQVKITAQPADPNKLVAPIKKGAVVGTVTAEYKGQKKQVNLIAAEDVEKGSWIRLMFRAIKNFFVTMFSKVANMI